MDSNLRRARRHLWAAALLGVVTLAAWEPGTARAQDGTSGRVPAAVAQLDGLVTAAMRQANTPGISVGVVYKGEVVYLKGFGVRETGNPAPVDPDTVFQLASVSKPISSTVIAGLVGDGVFSWDDPLIKHDPSFTMYDPWVTSQVTARDMFSHRSGLPEGAGDIHEDLEYSREEILSRLRFYKPEGPFRASYNYGNFGITEAGVAAANAAKTTWEDLAADRLYKPLGMSSTSSRDADFFAAPNRARGHVLEDGRYVAKYMRETDAESPAGGVSSSARDLTRWIRMLLAGGMYEGRQVIAKEALQDTHRPQIVSSPAQDADTGRSGFYGLGWNVDYNKLGNVRISHSGAFALGAATVVSILPGEEVGIVILTNAAPTGVPEAIAQSFLDLVEEGTVQADYLTLFAPIFEQLGRLYPGYTTDYSTPPTPRTPAMPLAVYTGTYENDLYGPIEIAERDGGLAILLGPKKLAFPTRHYDRDIFVYQPFGETAGGPAGVTFTVGADGKATNVLVENLNKEGQGAFARVTTAR